MISFVNDSNLKVFENDVKDNNYDHVLGYYNNDVKVNVIKQYEFLLHLQHDTIHDFNITVYKYTFCVPQSLYKRLLYETVPLYAMSVLDILRYAHYDNNFDLTKLLSAKGVKLAQKLNKLDNNKSKQVHCLGYVRSSKFGVEIEPFWLNCNNNNNVKSDDALMASYVIIPVSLLVHIRNIKFNDILRTIFSTYLCENIVNDKKLVFKQPVTVIEAIKAAANSWQEDSEAIMFYYHKLNKILAKQDKHIDNINNKHHMVKLCNENDIEFDTLLNIVVDVFDMQDMNHVASSYHDYRYTKQDKFKFKQNKSQQHVTLQWCHRHASGSNLHRYWLTQKEYNTGKMGPLTKKIYESQSDE